MPNSTNATTVQEHLRELQNLVQDALKQWSLATNSAAASALAGQTTPSRFTNELHPLGPVQVGTLQRDYREKIAAIRAICLSFAQGPLHQSINSGDSSNAAAFRKYSSLLKEENTLDEALYAVKSSLKQCQKTLSAASQDGNIKSDHLINTIRDMATDLGLECYLETGSRPEGLLSVSTLTIGGNVIVIDIDVDGTGAILRVKVSYASEIHQDERIDRLLAHNLQCKCSKLLQTESGKGKAPESKFSHLPDCSRNFDAFSKNLKALATLDSFSKKYPDVDFFHNIRSMDVDLKELFRREVTLSGRNLQRILTHGHGIPMMHAVLPGPSVAYWASKADLLDVSWDDLLTAIEQGANEKVKIPFNRISISMEEAKLPSAGHLPISRTGFLLSEEDAFLINSVPYGSIMNDQGSVSATTILQQPLKWIVPSADAAVEAAYVAVLHPPVIVAEDVAKQLAALSNQAGLNTTMGFHKDSGYLTLQESLISKSTEQTQWVVTLDQGPNALRQCYSFDRTKNEARLIHRIPFTHISQVYICTKLLRQQVAFNTLFQSCFKESESEDETKKQLSPGNSDEKHDVSIIIQTPQPPNMILASFLNPYTETNMVLEILIEAGTGIPTVRLVNSKYYRHAIISRYWSDGFSSDHKYG
ncbi:mediator of RNA polymerase II transcription subunit 1-domain-containing protein [Mortierella sp. GBAus27b]|nr:mediator of RNA polymerase II transcription subunit 1-domain-containing protein [Mortierella sp. GBAus27b]